ncbi:histidine kinase [Saccharopolyspora subtropica]|uniref:histidine kinase n=1 Tax=Saccharopolyspora thermophila TaxID=89367 RepID=A0A917N8A6_9PSEU|nr:nitrate- and nitrite sensing domain-containing protein [Saccharopolyspora subtropica]GGI76534.1 histidine kinase [Saccharopolyspora subtropica]
MPSAILLVIWLGLASATVYEAYCSRLLAAGVTDASLPSVHSLTALQKERRLALERLNRPGTDPAALPAQRAATDRAVGQLRMHLRTLANDAPPEIGARIRDLTALLDQLPQQRARYDAGQASRTATVDFYNRLLDAGVALVDTQARVMPDARAGQARLTATEMLRATDQMSRATSLGTAALARGQFSTEDHLSFVHLVGAYRTRLDTAMAVAEPRAAELYRRLIGSEAWRRVTAVENTLVEHPPQRSGRFGVDQAAWREATGEVSDDLAAIVAAQADSASDIAMDDTNTRLAVVLAGSAAVLVAMLLGIVLTTRNARRLVDRTLLARLAKLRDDTLELTSRRLPDIMSKLDRGERVDVAAELAPLDHGVDEIGQVADAFSAAHHTAVAAAVRESEAREGATKVFLGIAHRNQGLVYRQLKVLDRMERSEEHPERLDGLFQLDHLATRARRNAENLIILAGEQPGRQWRKPVRLVDVVRAAVAETEHYYRIHVHPTPDVSLVGAAVGDVIHLLAELMDNATSFSSPRSQVQVYSSDTPRGVLLQIEDEGLGMRPADRDEANALLASTPRFEDITRRGDSRLGLFVVARLAARRNIEVDLREAAEGGTVAFVRLPPDIVAAEPLFDRGAGSADSPTWARGPAPAASHADAPQFPVADPDAEPPPRRKPGQRSSGRLLQPEGAGQFEPSPERTRDNMTAFQRGTQAARRAEGGE